MVRIKIFLWAMIGNPEVWLARSDGTRYKAKRPGTLGTAYALRRHQLSSRQGGQMTGSTVQSSDDLCLNSYPMRSASTPLAVNRVRACSLAGVE
jgi:hypothetical protein